MRSLARWSADEASVILQGGTAQAHQVALQHHGVLIDSPPRHLNFAPLASHGVVVATVEPDLHVPTNETADLRLIESEVRRFSEIVSACPIAASVCARQLRLAERVGATATSETDGVLLGLELESLSYATLQAGPEFAAWLDRQPRRVRRPADAGSVVVVDNSDHVEIQLHRPRLKNAFDAALRNALLEALDALAHRPDLETVTLSGTGTAFCIGGDLAEFGSVENPADAHLIRLTTSVAGRLVQLEPTLKARVHGATVGAGVELAAFADQVTADRKTTFRLPEVTMGLLPGAGGSVSITRRVGRHNAARLLLLDQTIDADHALSLGLVDHISHTGHISHTDHTGE